MNPLAADKRFFNALIAGDVQALNRILADDFILIDVMSGSEITKAAFLAATGSGQVKFEAFEPAGNFSTSLNSRMNFLPKSVSRYSTRGGISGNWTRSKIPARVK